MHDESMFIRPLVGLMRGQPKEIIEQVTIDEIKTHRRLGREADALYERLDSDPSVEPAYLSKMIEMFSQQSALATMLEILGYIPDVPGDKMH